MQVLNEKQSTKIVGGINLLGGGGQEIMVHKSSTPPASTGK